MACSEEKGIGREKEAPRAIGSAFRPRGFYAVRGLVCGLFEAVVHGEVLKVVFQAAVVETLQVGVPRFIVVDVQLTHDELGVGGLHVIVDGGAVHRFYLFPVQIEIASCKWGLFFFTLFCVDTVSLFMIQIFLGDQKCQCLDKYLVAEGDFSKIVGLFPALVHWRNKSKIGFCNPLSNAFKQNGMKVEYPFIGRLFLIFLIDAEKMIKNEA